MIYRWMHEGAATIYSEQLVDVGTFADVSWGSVAPVAWTGPGDKASKLILGLANWVRNATDEGELRAQVTKRVSATWHLVGVRCTDLDCTVAETAVLSMARSCGGLVFTGTALLDSDGSLLVGSI